MTKKKRLERLAAEPYESKYQVIALNRSTKWEGKPGYYNGKPIKSRFILLGDLATFTKNEITEQDGVTSIYG